MAPDPRIKKACNAMKEWGYNETRVRPVIRELRKTYDNNWNFIEDDGYKVLIDALLDHDEPQATEMKKTETKIQSRAVTMNRGKKKALEVAVEDEEDDIDEDEAPLKKRRNRGIVCENNSSLSLGSSSTSKTPNKEDRKQTQLALKDKDDDIDEHELQRGCGNKSLCLGSSSTSKTPNKENHKQTQLAVKDKDDDIDEHELQRGCGNKSLCLGSPLPKKPNEEDCKQIQLAARDEVYDIDEDECETGCDNNTSLCLTLGSPELNEEDRKSEEEDKHAKMTELPPVKRYTRRTSERGSDVIKAGDAENCSTTVLEIEKSVMSVEERGGETDVTLNDTISMDVLSSETAVSEMIKAGDESGAADISMELVVVPEYEISEHGCWREISTRKDISLGKENIEIPWVNEFNDEVPSRFYYIPQSVVFQDAAVKFSSSSVSDDQCCFSCIGDCLDSSTMPCNCTIAYAADGVLKEDFLEARISEARDQRKQVLQFCQECPLEKARKEEVLEPCKGHIKRKAIRECWIKCGCGKKCGNRLVQIGIHNKLEVFFTPNGKGWGLRTLERLPQGAFVCEYIGEILTISELYQRSLDNELTCPVILDAFWGSEESLEDNKSLCLDGTRFGSISRFLNHRCLDANLIEIPVNVETPDQHYYHMAFFTTRDIEAMEELTWDYGIDFNDDDCPMKPFDCLCGSRFCRNAKRSKKAKKVINRA